MRWTSTDQQQDKSLIKKRHERSSWWVSTTRPRWVYLSIRNKKNQGGTKRAKSYESERWEKDPNWVRNGGDLRYRECSSADTVRVYVHWKRSPTKLWRKLNLLLTILFVCSVYLVFFDPLQWYSTAEDIEYASPDSGADGRRNHHHQPSHTRTYSHTYIYSLYTHTYTPGRRNPCKSVSLPRSIKIKGERRKGSSKERTRKRDWEMESIQHLSWYLRRRMDPLWGPPVIFIET